MACLDLEKAYDRVNQSKLFDILQRMGMCEKVLRVLKEVYKDNKLRFVLRDLVTMHKWGKAGLSEETY